MALYIPHSIFHLVRLLYVRPEMFGPHYVSALVFGCSLFYDTWTILSKYTVCHKHLHS